MITKIKSIKFTIIFLAVWIFNPSDELKAQKEKPSYFFWSANYMFAKYPQPLASRTSFALHVPTSTHIPLHLDAFGYYRAWNDLTLIGGVMRIDVDRYSAYGESLQIESYQPSISAFHYLDGQVGSGLFVRGDVGPAFLRVYSGDRRTETTNFGWGYLLGTGASMTLRSVTVLTSFNYAYKSFHGKIYQFFSMGLGVMIKKTR